MAKQTSHLPEGTLLSGRYRIVKFIGSGGFGCTYLADHLLFGTKVAIKEFFVSSLCNRDNTGVVSIGTESQTMIVEKLANKFLREARNLNKLSHPNIVRVSDVFVENGTNYYVMDYIEGRSLHATMYYDGPLSEARMMNYMNQIMDALEYLHSRNMLHLDIKPDNIMVDGNDRAILIDFGVAKQYGDGTNEGSSTVMGQTPGFAPLEQMSNNVKSFSAATDIYALGATMYALLTGVTPPTAPELASGVAELQPLPPYVSDNTRHALAAMMEIRNADRLQSISEVRAMLAGKPLPANRSGNRFPTAQITDDADDDIGAEGTPSQSTLPLNSPALPPIHDYSYDTNSEEPKKKKGLLIGIIVAAASIILGLGIFAVLNFTDIGKDKKGENIAMVGTENQIDEPKQDEEDHTEDVEDPQPSDVDKETNSDTSGSNNTSTATTTPVSTGTNTGSGSNANTGTNTGTGANANTNNEPVMPTPVQITTGVSGQNGHNYVDMGNGMYWAICNIGASTPEGLGNYYAWGETTTKSDYSSKTYEFQDMTLEATIKGTQYDAASKIWGPSWQTPNEDDWKRLINSCNWEARDNGVLLTSNITGNTLFLPCAGHMNSSKKNPCSYYWTSDSNGGNNALVINISDPKGTPFQSKSLAFAGIAARRGVPIRPIYKP